MAFIRRSLFSFTTLCLALSANACAVSGSRSPETGALDRSCEGGAIISAVAAARFTGCTSVQGSLRVSAPDLEDLSALSALRSVSGTLEITRNPQLDDLAGLEQLVRVGSLSIRDNPELDDLAGLERLREARSVVIEDNAELSSLRGLSGITHLESLRIERNAGLFQTAGLSRLSEVGNLSIQNNPQLNSLRGLSSLTHAGSIEIRKNPRLCALGMLPALRHVDAEISLSDNRGLSQLELHQLLGRIDQGAAASARDGVAQLEPSLR
jgi:hypothetical protein